MRFLTVVIAITTACASAPQRPAAAPADEAPPGRAAKIVNATILANGCQKLGTSNAQLAEHAMYDLVEDCRSVPGGSARFGATLQPGGRIEITPVAGYADVVPICVLKHSLFHRVPLAKPCRLDVRIEEAHVSVP